MAHFNYISSIVLCVSFLILRTSFTTGNVDSCPDHCHCFVVSRNSPPSTALLYNYMQINDWTDGSEAMACWGRSQVPQHMHADIKYLVLIGAGKPKRRRQDDTRFVRSRSYQFSTDHGRSDTAPNMIDVRRRNIRLVSADAFTGLNGIIQIDLHGNKIVALHPNTFQDLSRLLTLSLNENRLKSLHVDLLEDLIELRQLHIAGNHIRLLPTGLFRKSLSMEHLDMSDNLLKSIPDGCLHSLRNLKFLNLSYNRLDETSEHMFTGLSKLMDLNLRKNKFNIVKVNVFASNSRLQTLDLSDNRIQTLFNNSFRNQRYLQMLDLSGNMLVKLNSVAFHGAVALKTLDLSANALQHIMIDAFSGLSNLTKLYLNGNQITTIAKNTFGEIASLTYLNLAENNISDIEPVSMAGLEMVTYLDLSRNTMRHLRARTFQGMTKLMELNLGDNLLYEIEPESFKTTSLSFLSQLTWLNMQGNNIRELQRDVFRGAPSLRVLSVTRNRIDRITPEAFSGFSRLHRLMMSDNAMESIQDGTFKLLRMLEMLDISNNRLHEISRDAFKGLGGLSNLNLAKNSLTDGNMQWLTHLGSIQTLNLNHNKYRELISNAFETASNLRYLYISNNGLANVFITNTSRLYLYNLTMSHNSLTSLAEFHPHILPGRALDLSSNPWRCDCKTVSRIWDMMNQHGIRLDTEENTRCETPIYLQGIKVTSLVRSSVHCVGSELTNTSHRTDDVTEQPITTVPPATASAVMQGSKRSRWSWVVVLWDTTTAMPICNGALLSSNFVLTSSECLNRVSNMVSHLRLLSRCRHPLNGNCQDVRWRAPNNLVIRIGHGHRTMSHFPTFAETYHIQSMYKPSGYAASSENLPVLLQLTSSVSSDGLTSTIDLVAEGALPNDLDGKRVLVSGWWVDATRAPQVVGRQKRRHYIISSNCGSQNDIDRLYLCGYVEQDLGNFTTWDSLGASVSIREQDEWKLVGLLVRTEGNVGVFEDLRQDREWIHQILTEETVLQPITHPY